MSEPTASAEATAPDKVAADRADERFIASQGFGGAVSSFFDRLRSGEMGSLPVVIGLVIIWGVFQALNPAFLSSRNLVNLSLQSAAIGTLALASCSGFFSVKLNCPSGRSAGFPQELSRCRSSTKGGPCRWRSWPRWAPE